MLTEKALTEKAFVHSGLHTKGGEDTVYPRVCSLKNRTLVTSSNFSVHTLFERYMRQREKRSMQACFYGFFRSFGIVQLTRSLSPLPGFWVGWCHLRHYGRAKAINQTLRREMPTRFFLLRDNSTHGLQFMIVQRVFNEHCSFKWCEFAMHTKNLPLKENEIMSKNFAILSYVFHSSVFIILS